MLRRLTLVLTLIAMVGLIAAPAVSAAPPARGSVTQDVTGTLADGTEFVGTVTLDSIIRQGEQLIANVTLTGNGIDPTAAAVPLQTGAECSILQLDLGPIFLDLLGLQLDVSAISIDLTAVPGSGNLLGNLLCAVAGLLDGPNPLGNLIDRLLEIVNNLLG